MKTKKEKERINKKYGEAALTAPYSTTEITKKAKEAILNIIKTSSNRIVAIDTDCIWHHHA